LPSLFDVKKDEWPAVTRSTAEALSVSMNGEDDLMLGCLISQLPVFIVSSD
jgi:hypothetical protein